MSNVINHEDIEYDHNLEQYFLITKDDESVKEFLKNNIKEDSILETIYCDVFLNSQSMY